MGRSGLPQLEGRYSNKLEGWRDSGPDKSAEVRAGLQEGIRQGERRSLLLRE